LLRLRPASTLSPETDRLIELITKGGLRLSNLTGTLGELRGFFRGAWRYWRLGETAQGSHHLVQKLYAYTDGRSNDILFRILESKRREAAPTLSWNEVSLETCGISDQSIEAVVRTLQVDGVAVVPPRLKKDAVRSLYELASSCSLKTTTYGTPGPEYALGIQETVPIVETGTSTGVDPSNARCAVYQVPREILLENRYVQGLLCDPYLLTVATRYLGVFPIVTRPDMWWDTNCVPQGLRPRPFHVDEGCLRWLKVGVYLTDTTIETPHFVYVKGSHHPNQTTRPLTRRLTSRMNLSNKEVTDVCPEKIVHVTAPAGSIFLADTRGIHKGELSLRGCRLVLFFGLEGSAFNDAVGTQPSPLNKIEPELEKAMSERPFSYQFFRTTH